MVADATEMTPGQTQAQTPALLLLPGDPLPALAVDPGFSLDAFAGGWLLLVACEGRRAAELAGLAAAVNGVRRCEVRGLLRGELSGGGGAGPHFLDIDGAAADALGALEFDGARADVAVLVDPRGVVRWAGRWLGSAAVVEALAELWRMPRT